MGSHSGGGHCLVILESSWWLDFSGPLKPCNIPLHSSSTGLGKILPMSAVDIRLAQHAFQEVCWFGGSQVHYLVLLSILSNRLWSLRSVAVGGLSQLACILQFLGTPCNVVLFWMLSMGFWLCYLFVICRDPGRFRSMQLSSSSFQNICFFAFTVLRRKWMAINIKQEYFNKIHNSQKYWFSNLCYFSLWPGVPSR